MHRVAALIVSTYITVLLYTNAFFIKTLTIAEGADQHFWNHLAVFLIILIPVYFLISNLISLSSSGPLGGLLQVIALTGLLLAILYHVIPVAPVYDLPTQIDKYFATDTAYTLWLIAPLLALFI